MRDAQRRLFDNRVSRALQLKAIAPEYYETLAYHTSWTWVTWKFLSDPEVGPWTRMRRPTREAAPRACHARQGCCPGAPAAQPSKSWPCPCLPS